MAFDMPLEADQPGETRFFLSFVTSPVVGTLMWILGGDSESKDDKETSESTEDEHDKVNTENDDGESTNSISKIDAHLPSSSKTSS